MLGKVEMEMGRNGDALDHTYFGLICLSNIDSL